MKHNATIEHTHADGSACSGHHDHVIGIVSSISNKIDVDVHGHNHRLHAVMRQPSAHSHDHDHHKVSTDVPTVVSSKQFTDGQSNSQVQETNDDLISLKNFDDDHGHDHHHNH